MEQIKQEIGTENLYLEEAQKLIYSVFNIIEQDFEGMGGVNNIEAIFTDLCPEPFASESPGAEFILAATMVGKMPEYLIITMRDGTWYHVYKNKHDTGEGPKYNVRLFGLAGDENYWIGNLGKQVYNLNIEN